MKIKRFFKKLWTEIMENPFSIYPEDTFLPYYVDPDFPNVDPDFPKPDLTTDHEPEDLAENVFGDLWDTAALVKIYMSEPFKSMSEDEKTKFLEHRSKMMDLQVLSALSQPPEEK